MLKSTNCLTKGGFWRAAECPLVGIALRSAFGATETSAVLLFKRLRLAACAVRRRRVDS